MRIFNIFKKNWIEIYSPLNGQVIDLSEVDDPAFAGKMIGDGCAILPDKGSICAPTDAEINIFDTNHAVSFETEDELEIIVHFGMDTVALDGEGFTRLVKSTGNVKQGEKLVTYDLDFIQNNARSIKTPVIINNMEDVEKIEVVASGTIKAGDLLMRIKKK